MAALRGLRRFGEAESAVRAAIEARPREPGLLIELGYVHSDQYRYEVALEWFEKALEVDPLNSTALKWRVAALRWLRRFGEAESAVRAAIEAWPREPGLLIELGYVHDNQANYEVALEWFEKALEVDPLNSIALKWRVTALRRLRRFGEAESAVRAAIEARPREPGLLIELGYVHNDQYRYEVALEWFEKALEVDPLNSTALKWRVTALRGLRRFGEAESAVRAAIEARPREPRLLIELGYVHDNQANYEAALEWFEKALQLDPRNVSAINARSVVLRSLRRFDEAERALARAIHGLPRERGLRAELGWIHHDLRNLDQSARIFTDLLNASIGFREKAECLHSLGWVKFAWQDYRAAEDLLRSAHDLDPGKIRYRLGLAWCLARQKNTLGWSDADQLCFSIIKEDPTNHSAHTCLGVVNYQRGGYAQAEYHLKKSALLDSQHGSYVDLGALYTQLGRFDEAAKYLQKALERDWYDCQAHIELGHLLLRQNFEEGNVERRATAVRHFRQARQIDPANGSASLGLALSLSQPPGDLIEAEAVLQDALRRRDCDHPRWQLLVAVARLLIERGDATHTRQFYLDALVHAQEAISLASRESEPYFVAAVTRYKLAEMAGDLTSKPIQRRMAVQNLRRAIKLDPGNFEAGRSLRVVEESLRISRNGAAGSTIVMAIGTIILGALWVAFFVSDKITTLMLTALTPVLVGLVIVGFLMPLLIRLKLPGVEADLAASIRQISSGPTGDETFGPGKFGASVSSAGPKGQIPRLK